MGRIERKGTHTRSQHRGEHLVQTVGWD